MVLPMKMNNRNRPLIELHGTIYIHTLKWKTQIGAGGIIENNDFYVLTLIKLPTLNQPFAPLCRCCHPCSPIEKEEEKKKEKKKRTCLATTKKAYIFPEIQIFLAPNKVQNQSSKKLTVFHVTQSLSVLINFDHPWIQQETHSHMHHFMLIFHKSRILFFFLLDGGGGSGLASSIWK